MFLLRRPTHSIGLPAAGNWLLAGTFVTTVGNGVQAFAVGKLLYDLTGSIAAFGVVIIVEQAVNVLMQVLAGPWVDRGDPKRTCVQVEVVRGLVVCGASLMLGNGSFFGWVVLMTLVIRIAQPFYRAATFSLAPAVVPAESLGRFNGFSNVALQSGQLVGVAVAGVVIERWGATPAFLINGLSFLFSALAVAIVARPTPEPVEQLLLTDAMAAGRHLVAAWAEIAALIRTEASLGWHLVISTADSVAIYLFNLVIVAVIAERFGGSAEWLSAVEVAFAVGAIGSGAIVSQLTERWGVQSSVVIGIGGQAVCFVLLGLLREPSITLPLAFGLGAFNTISWTVVTTTLQLRVRKTIKGRIGTARNLLTALITVGLVPLVSALQAASLEWALLMSGAVCLMFVAIPIWLGRRRYARSVAYAS